MHREGLKGLEIGKTVYPFILFILINVTLYSLSDPAFFLALIRLCLNCLLKKKCFRLTILLPTM